HRAVSGRSGAAPRQIQPQRSQRGRRDSSFNLRGCHGHTYSGGHVFALLPGPTGCGCVDRASEGQRSPIAPALSSPFPPSPNLFLPVFVFGGLQGGYSPHASSNSNRTPVRRRFKRIFIPINAAILKTRNSPR